MWIAIGTVNLADEIVSRTQCHPTVLKSHENFAYYTAWTFSAALLIDLLKSIPPLFLEFLQRTFMQWILLIILLAGGGMLTYVGHLGSDLVYNQAAGLEVPGSDCSEFE